MSESKKNVPKRRFKEFENADDWEQRKVGELTNVISAARVHKEEWASAGIPFFRSSDVVSAYKGTENEKVFISYELFEQLSRVSGKLAKDDVLVTGGGSIGIPYIVPNNTPLYSKDADLIWIKSSKKFNSQYLYTFFTTSCFRNYVSSIAHIGTIAHYTIEQVKGTPIYIPSIAEQEKVGVFFKQLDNLITLHQRKLEKMKALKKAYLTEMFPAKGERKPKLRFAGFTDDWEQCKLLEMTDYKNGKGHEERQATSGKYELINLNSISIDGGLKHSGKFVDETDTTLNKNDLVMVLSDVGHGDLLGRVALIPDYNRFVLNQRVALLRPNKTVNPNFLFFNINAHQSYFKSQGAGMSQLNISKSSVEDFTSYVPTLVEQEKIGTFFTHLDTLITLHQHKLEKLQNINKAYLNEMFI